MSSPAPLSAVLICNAAVGSLEVGALTLLDRLLVTVHRAGCAPIHVVCAGPPPRLRRAPALGIAFTVTAAIPPVNGPVLAASAGVLVTVNDLKAMLASKARLISRDGVPLPIGVAGVVTGNLATDLAECPSLTAAGVAEQVTDRPSARVAERKLWASLTSASDGFVDRHFNRPAGRPLSKLLIHTAVTPNQVSIAATFLGVVSAVCFALGAFQAAILGAVLLQISAIIDCVDGDLARMVFKESPLGKWLDLVGDQIVHIGVFVALGIGLWRAGVDAPVLPLAVSAGVGVIVSFGVVLRGQLKPELPANSALQRLIDATTNRDFSVLLLALACLDRLEWFLWLAGIGVHLFWMTLLWLQRRRAPAAA